MVSDAPVAADLTEFLFYHLENQSLDQVLPSLLERTIERGWRAVVQAGSVERADALSAVLWTYRDDSFLPHGGAKDGNADAQPIYVTSRDDNPNGAGVCFLVDGANRDRFNGFVRVVVIFDGGDEDALAGARQQWRDAKAAGFGVTYWQQVDGRWTKRA